MQVAQPVVLRIIYYYSVHIRHVDATLDNGGCQQHVIVMVSEVDNALFQLLGRHLPMSDHYSRVGHQAVYHSFEVEKRFNAIVDKEYLSVA